MDMGPSVGYHSGLEFHHISILVTFLQKKEIFLSTISLLLAVSHYRTISRLYMAPNSSIYRLLPAFRPSHMCVPEYRLRIAQRSKGSKFNSRVTRKAASSSKMLDTLNSSSGPALSVSEARALPACILRCSALVFPCRIGSGKIWHVVSLVVVCFSARQGRRGAILRTDVVVDRTEIQM